MTWRTATFLRVGKAAVLALGVSCVCAEDNTSNIISGTTSNNAGADFIVGNTGTNNSLTISAGGILTNVNFGYIGNAASASNNWVVITDNGSLWRNKNSLTIGQSGLCNSLIVSNGGRVLNTYGYLGSNDTSSGNSVLVTGSASVWTNTITLYVGCYGSSNMLAIANGGRVFNSVGCCIGNQTNADSNAVFVTGSGSVWNSNNALIVGNYGSGNTLTISNSGAAYNTIGVIGYEVSANVNAVLVSDLGSVWNNSSNLYVGCFGSANALTISNGGFVRNSIGFIGYTSDSSNNAVVVTDSGSIWTNTATLCVGCYGSSNTLNITNGGRVFNTVGYIGSNTAANGNSVLVTGLGSIWNNSNKLFVGVAGSSNTLTIANGGTVYNTIGYVGYDTNSHNNAVLITDTGSVWNNSSNLFVGRYSCGNVVTIASSGTVCNIIGYLGYGGAFSRASNNAVIVTGSGSVWSNGGRLYVGGGSGVTNSWGNSLIVTNGGTVYSDKAYIGYNIGASNNNVIVSGTGSVWSNGSDLYVGSWSNDTLASENRGNALTIANGGTVYSSNGYIGQGGVLCYSNIVTVTGAGSVWINTGYLYVGYNSWFFSTLLASQNNTLIISNGGAVCNAVGYVGFTNNATVIVTGSGSVWNNADLYVGLGGISNQLIIADGGMVVATNIIMGTDESSINHPIIISGGTLVASNATATALLDVRRGMIILNNGTVAANTVLLSGINAILTGTGTIAGNILVNGTIQADTGTGLTFVGGTVTNNGVLRASNGVLESYGPVINNGVIDVIYGNTNFHSTFINNGIVLTADGDPDGDGMSNLQELLASTSPTNSTSCLRILSVACASNDVCITWTAVGGKSYVVQTNSVPGNGFADFSPVISVPGSGESVTNYVHTGGATNSRSLFYRVRLGP